MMIRRKKTSFDDCMTPAQRILGWIYLLLHVAGLPLLLRLYARFSPDPVSTATLNLIYYAIGIVFCLTAMYGFLRGSFDRLIDNFRICLLTIAMALMIDYALSGVAALVLLLADKAVNNPNNAEIIGLAQENGGTVKAIAIFLAPIVEEVLFRGVVFGTFRRRGRFLAYFVSAVLFSVYHVWQYAAQDPVLLVYALQYIPVSIALAWAYERSGSIWTNIFFHMGFNAMSFFVLNAIQN